MEAAITQAAEDIAPLLARVMKRHGLPAAALPAMIGEWLRRPGGVRLDEALLDRKAVDFLALRERLVRPLGDAETQRLRLQAAAALDTGRIGEADKALAQAELNALGTSKDLTTLSAERRVWMGENRADRAAASFLRTTAEAYREAAGRYAEASAIVGLAGVARSRAMALAQAQSLGRLSEDFGGRDGFDAGIEHCRRLVAGLDGFEEPEAFAAAQYTQAHLLRQLAIATDRTDGLGDALKACRAALEVLGRDDDRALWRKIQALSGALALALGEERMDEALLDEAVASLAAALSVWDRDRDGPGWLDAEYHIARARSALGTIRVDLALLERAFNSFNRVAMAIERAREPLRWAELQDAMGGVLAAMGERYSEPVVLEEAVAAFGAALEERSRERVPVLWAITTTNRAQASMRIAERTKDLELARQALAEIAGAVETLKTGGHAERAAAIHKRLLAAGAAAQRIQAAAAAGGRR